MNYNNMRDHHREINVANIKQHDVFKEFSPSGRYEIMFVDGLHSYYYVGAKIWAIEYTREEWHRFKEIPPPQFLLSEGYIFRTVDGKVDFMSKELFETIFSKTNS